LTGYSVGLREGEKRVVFLYGPISFIVFMVGAIFGFCVIVPIGLKFLISFSSPNVIPMITLSKYISFVAMLTLNFGIVFELPIILIILTKLGIANPEFLASKRRYAFVLLFVLAAIVTPPDIVTQVLMAMPLVILFEIGIICSKSVYKKK